MYTKIKNELKEFRLLLKCIPATTVTIFVMTVFAMNLMANKSIAVPYSWLALDCGIIFSWLTFLAMDVITRQFGPRAATEISIFAVFINLIFCLLLFIASEIPGAWGESYVPGSEAVLNNALNRTFGGTWYVLAGSTAAFITSAFVNNYINAAVGRALRKCRHDYITYAARTYISTAIGQFTDNLVFSLLVSRIFFGWSLTQCVVCALTGMLVELLCEIVFSPVGFRICEKWRREKVGIEYMNAVNRREGADA